MKKLKPSTWVLNHHLEIIQAAGVVCVCMCAHSHEGPGESRVPTTMETEYNRTRTATEIYAKYVWEC